MGRSPQGAPAINLIQMALILSPSYKVPFLTRIGSPSCPLPLNLPPKWTPQWPYIISLTHPVGRLVVEEGFFGGQLGLWVVTSSKQARDFSPSVFCIDKTCAMHSQIVTKPSRNLSTFQRSLARKLASSLSLLPFFHNYTLHQKPFPKLKSIVLPPSLPRVQTNLC